MSFWRKLFKRKKKSEDLVEETRIISTVTTPDQVKVIPIEESPTISSSDSNGLMSTLIFNAMVHGEMKKYHNLCKFIKDHPKLDIEIPDNAIINIEKTKEIELLLKIWERLSYKCSNKQLSDLIEKLK